MWQEIRCRAPTYHPGVTTVEVSDVFGVFSDSKVEFEYQAAARVFALSPPTGPAGGSTVVVVSGRERALMNEWLGDLPIWLVAENGLFFRPPRH